MRRYIIIGLLSLCFAGVAAAMPADEVSDALTRAESLYFEAKFRDAIQLLQHADEVLKPRNDRTPDKLNVKLQLALAHIGLNETEMAKISLRELFAIDAEYKLDPQQFPPKVLMLADQARGEQIEARCQSIRADARKLLEGGNATALYNLTQPMKSKCAGLDAMDPDLSNMFYKMGVDQYKLGRYSDALEKFQLAL